MAIKTNPEKKDYKKTSSKNTNTKKTDSSKTHKKRSSATKSAASKPSIKKTYANKTYSKRKKKSKKTSDKALFALIATVIALVIIIIAIITLSSDKSTTVELTDDLSVTEAFLTPNEYSRPEIPLETINGIVIHYTANPGSTAIQNRNYFEGLKEGTNGTYASSHFIIGLEGEIIQCIPLTEEAYASNERNADTISIECCHPDESGEFTEDTYNSLVKLTSYLCSQYNITTDSIIRHYDITEKLCPKYYVEHEDKWNDLLSDIKLHISSSD